MIKQSQARLHAGRVEAGNACLRLNGQGNKILSAGGGRAADWGCLSDKAHLGIELILWDGKVIPVQFQTFSWCSKFKMGFLPGKRAPLTLLLFVGIAINLSQGLVYNTSAPSCGIPGFPPSPILPACAANASATIEEAIARASLYAPVVHFHPLEQWHLQESCLI